jgi:hypothetical protein
MFCKYERKNFPASEFHIDPRYGWLHSENVKQKHTINGKVIQTMIPTVIGVDEMPGSTVQVPRTMLDLPTKVSREGHTNLPGAIEGLPDE